MSILDSLVMPADILMIPVSEAPESIRREFAGELDNFIITRAGIRTNSQIIDASTAQFLEEFRNPKTVVDAVINYGSSKNLNPEQLLPDIARLAQTLLDKRLLVVAGSIESQKIVQTFSINDKINDFQVIGCIQLLEDTEIYKVKTANGNQAALKIAGIKSSRETKKIFEREALILSYLNETVSPKLLETSKFKDRFYIATEWLNGISASAAATNLRNQGIKGRAELIKLCINLLESYSKLHRAGIIHGDIHPHNIIVGEKNSIKLIDFANAETKAFLPDLPSADRAGIAYFYEPEYAKNILANLNPPAVTFLSEQYALGALIYLLVTGRHHIDFSFEEDNHLRQITEMSSLLPFSQRGIEPLPAIEAVLTKALSKLPEERFSTTEEFKAAFETAFESIEKQSKTKSSTESLANSNFHVIKTKSVLETMISQLAVDGLHFRKGLPIAPTCSVCYGAAGIAYALYRIACIRDEAQTLSLADTWITKAHAQSKNVDAFYNSAFQITHQTIGNISPFHTISGIYCVQAHIFNALGAQELCDCAVDKFISASSLSCDNLDLTLGKSGSLSVAALLLDLSPQNSKLLNFGSKIMSVIWKEIESLSSIRDSNRFELLGMAHGWAGIFYAVMNWCKSSGQILPSNFFGRLEQLADYAAPASHGKKWQLYHKSINQQKYLPGWCNGSAGYVFLWTLAHRFSQEEKYLLLAEQTAENVYKNTTIAGESLCCGSAGQAYALLNIYKYTGESRWLKYSRKSFKRATRNESVKKKFIHSLYKGSTGIALLEADLLNPEQAIMPFFESSNL